MQKVLKIFCPSLATILCLTTIILTTATVNAQETQGSCGLDSGAADNNIPKSLLSYLYRGQQSFAVSLLEAAQQATPNDNIFFSPYSTYHALLLAYFGSQGDVEAELSNALNLKWATDKSHVHRGYRLEKQLRLSRAKKMPLEFSSADRLYFDKSIKITSCISSNFIDEVESIDIANNPEQSRSDINSWIASVTKNQIPELLKGDDVTSQTELVVVNAAYFKGQWASKFDPEDTKLDIFYTSKNQTSFVQMMHKTAVYNLFVDDDLGAYVLQMPYLTSNDEDADSDISMVIILPPIQESLDKVLSKLTPDSLERALNYSMPREIKVSFPKFDFERNLELKPILIRMGIKKIFDSDGLTGFAAGRSFSIGDAKHLAKIKVDEDGSTAAAATALISFRSARPVEPTEFNCNHPFLFLIYDQKSKAVLFTGIYRKPDASV